MQMQKPSIPLVNGAHLIMSHALRCRCQVCNRILRWGDCDSVGVFEAVCCKLTYSLRPWTVKVTVVDGKPEILLPPHRENFFPINIDLLDYGTEVTPRNPLPE